MNKSANTDGQISTASVKIGDMKTANTDGQISSVTVTIGSGPLSESVKKEIDAMATSKDCAKNFCNYIGGWLDGSNLDTEMVYFKNKLTNRMANYDLTTYSMWPGTSLPFFH